jgi:predicted dehydrogenase
LELFFENGCFQVDNDFSGPISFQQHDDAPELLTEEQVRNRYLESVGLSEATFGDTLRYSLEDYFFLDAIARGGKPFPDFRVALQAHRIVDAVYRSDAAGGDEVSLR